MSTIKIKARYKTKKDNLRHGLYVSEDGRVFDPVWRSFSSKVEDVKDVQLYIINRLNVHHSQQSLFEIYPVPLKDLIEPQYPKRLKIRLGRGRDIVYEVKKK